jgi:hypothetical protein
MVYRHDILHAAHQEVMPARNATDAHAQDFVLKAELLLPILKAFIKCCRSLHTTGNARRFQSVCSTSTVTHTYGQQTPAPHHRRTPFKGIISWSVVCTFGFCSGGNRLCWLKFFFLSLFSFHISLSFGCNVTLFSKSVPLPIKCSCLHHFHSTRYKTRSSSSH